MGTPSDRRTAWLVFALVGAGFTTLYLPQPVLPQLRAETLAATVRGEEMGD